MLTARPPAWSLTQPEAPAAADHQQQPASGLDAARHRYPLAIPGPSPLWSSGNNDTQDVGHD